MAKGLGLPKRLEDSPTIFALSILRETGLYKWQMEAMEKVARGKRVALRVCNGGGKTDKVIGILALWFLWRYPRGRMPLTSGSWRQVKDQLWPALERHKNNPAFRGWKWLKNCRIETGQGGFIEGFSTNHAGKAEGWHGQIDDEFRAEREEAGKVITVEMIELLQGGEENAPVFFLVDEAKTVPDEIFDAIERCTLQFCLYASSPGKPFGQFFRCFHEEVNLFCPIVATAFDCPHITAERIQRMAEKVGEDSFLYRSSILSEFTLEGEFMIIDQAKLAEGQRKAKDKVFTESRRLVAFLDIAAGGDENVLALCDGHRVWIDYTERQADTVQAVRRCIRRMEDLGLCASDLWLDTPGLGKAVLNDFKEEGWHVNAFYGNVPATNNTVYLNCAAEAWNEAGYELTSGRIFFENADSISLKQLCDRKREWADDSKIRNESKEKMKERNVGSPDRADAVTGAIWAYLYGRTGVWKKESKPQSASTKRWAPMSQKW